MTNLAFQNFTESEVLRRRVLQYSTEDCAMSSQGLSMGFDYLWGVKISRDFMREQPERGLFFRTNDSIKPIWE